MCRYARHSQVPKRSPRHPKTSRTPFTSSQYDFQSIDPVFRLAGPFEGEEEEQVAGGASMEL